MFYYHEFSAFSSGKQIFRKSLILYNVDKMFITDMISEFRHGYLL
jgi:hypothetical protein